MSILMLMESVLYNKAKLFFKKYHFTRGNRKSNKKASSFGHKNLKVSSHLQDYFPSTSLTPQLWNKDWLLKQLLHCSQTQCTPQKKRGYLYLISALGTRSRFLQTPPVFIRYTGHHTIEVDWNWNSSNDVTFNQGFPANLPPYIISDSARKKPGLTRSLLRQTQ